MQPIKLAFTLAALTLGSAATAHELQFVYEQDLEGVYSQSWSVMALDNPFADKHEVYVKGDGKLGDFFGVLYVDCSAPQFSRWLAQGGFLTADSVPAAVIRIIRARTC